MMNPALESVTSGVWLLGVADECCVIPVNSTVPLKRFQCTEVIAMCVAS